MNSMKPCSGELVPAMEIEIESRDKRDLLNVLLSDWSQCT